MKKHQSDILKMYSSTYAVLQKFNSVWNTNVPFSDAVDALLDFIETINNLHTIQTQDNKGITADKKNTRRKLEARAFNISRTVVFYATVTENNKLYTQAYFPRSRFTLARDNELGGICKQVHKAASDNAAALLPYGLTAAMLNDLNVLISDFTSYISRPSGARIDRKEATAEMKKTFKAADALLKNQLDNGMELYSSSNKDFFTQYTKARIIVNSGTQTRALKISFFEENSNVILAGVKSKVSGKSIRPSGRKGINFVQHLEEGSHSIESTLEGYEAATAEFNIVKGETTKLIVKLKKK
jgi:hypothetical protein